MESIKNMIKFGGNGRYRDNTLGLFLNEREDVDPFQKPLDNMRKEYICRVEIGVRYACNDAEKEKASENAKRQLVRELYKEQNSILDDMYNAVYSGDIDSLIKLLGEMRDSVNL